MAQALGNLSDTGFEKLLGLKVVFKTKIRTSYPSRKEIKNGIIIGFSDSNMRVRVRTDAGWIYSRDLRGLRVIPEPRKNLSDIELEKLLGLKVVFECICNSRAGSRLKKTITKTGTITGFSKAPGFVVIEDERGGLHSRDLPHVWEDVVQAGIIECRHSRRKVAVFSPAVRAI